MCRTADLDHPTLKSNQEEGEGGGSQNWQRTRLLARRCVRARGRETKLPASGQVILFLFLHRPRVRLSACVHGARQSRAHEHGVDDMRKLRGSKPALKRVDTQAARAWMPCCGRVGQSLQSRMPQEVDPAPSTQECEPSGAEAHVRSRATEALTVRTAL